MSFANHFFVLSLLIASISNIGCQPEKSEPDGNLNVDLPASLNTRNLSGGCADNLWADVLIDNQATQRLQKSGDSWQGVIKITPGAHALTIEFKCATDNFGTITLATYTEDINLSANENLSLSSEHYNYPDNDHDGSSNLAEVNAGTDPGNPSNGFKWANPLPQGNNLQDIIWTGSEFLAVGTGGSILTSSDGRSWSLTHSAATNFLNSIAWSGTQYLVVGNNGTILSTTPNDSDWTPRDSGTDRHLLGVTWTGNLFVAVGLGVITTSPDGINWTLQKEVQALLTSVIWTGSKLIATGAILNDAERIEGAIFTSNDGTSWSPSLLTDIPLLWDVIWTGSQLVAVGGDKILDSEFNLGGIILTSPDGDSWVKQTSGTDVDLYAVNFDSNSGQITAAGGTSNLQTPDNPNNGVILSSPDGINWTSQDSTNNQTYLSLASSGSETVVVGLAGTIKSSADLQQWSNRTSGTVNTIFDMVSIGDRVIAVGENGETLTSLDGLSWASHNSGITANLFAVTWTGSQLVAVGGELSGTKNGVIVTSTDGISWANRTPTNSFGSIMDITWTGSQLVAVGAKGLILTSPNGVDWTSRNSTTKEDLWAITANSDQTMAAGDNGTVLTSPNSSNWTSIKELDENIDLRGLTWTDASFILVGGTFGRSGLDENTSMAFTSTNGTNWVPIDPGINDVMQDVAWTGSQLLAVAFNSSLLTSTDNARWTEIPTISSNGLYCVIEHRGITLIGGGNGTILYREN